MNLLPSMLIATTIIGGAGNVPADLSALQGQLGDSCANAQVIIGNEADLQSALEELCIDWDSIKDCLKPSLPDAGLPESAPETNVPEEDATTPDANLPNQDGNTSNPGTDAPENGGSNTEEDSHQGYAEQVVSLVNAERAKAGLPALSMDDGLSGAALIRAKEIVDSFSHTRPNGSSFSTVLEENGISYRGSGENIAWGQKSPEAVVNAWMNSEGHRANILSASYTSIGVGCFEKNGTLYWAQLFTY